MIDYEERYPKNISYEQYESEMQDKDYEIEELQNKLYITDQELEDSKIIIKFLMEGIKKYEGIIKKNNITI